MCILRSLGALVLTSAQVLIGACVAGQPEAPSIDDHYQSELESERSEFIAEAHQRLAEIDAAITELDKQLLEQPPRAEADRYAGLRKQLNELKEERMSLTAQIARAERASAAEWRRMRAPVGKGFDALEAGVDELTEKIRGLFDDS